MHLVFKVDLFEDDSGRKVKALFGIRQNIIILASNENETDITDYQLTDLG